MSNVCGWEGMPIGWSAECFEERLGAGSTFVIELSRHRSVKCRLSGWSVKDGVDLQDRLVEAARRWIEDYEVRELADGEGRSSLPRGARPLDRLALGDAPP